MTAWCQGGAGAQVVGAADEADDVAAGAAAEAVEAAGLRIDGEAGVLGLRDGGEPSKSKWLSPATSVGHPVLSDRALLGSV